MIGFHIIQSENLKRRNNLRNINWALVAASCGHGNDCTEFTEFFWTFFIVLYSKKHDVSETGSVSVLR
jgi:hypothetical protein